MTCPACRAPIAEQAPIGNVVLCDTCLRSVNATSGALATAADTLALSKEDVTALRARRKSYRAAGVPV